MQRRQARLCSRRRTTGLQTHRSLLPLAATLALAQLAVTAPAAAGKAGLGKRLGVHPVLDLSTGSPAAGELAKTVQRAVHAAGASNVMGQEELERVIADLKDKGLSCGPDDIECFSKIGVYTGLERLLVPRLRSDGKGWEVSFLLVDTALGKVVCETRAGPYPDVAAHLDQIHDAAVAAVREQADAGALLVRVHVEGAEISVDGTPLAANPTAARVEPLAAGEHVVEVRADGFETRVTRVKIAPGKSVVLDVNLPRLPGGADADSGGGPMADAMSTALSPMLWLGGSLVAVGSAVISAGAITGVAGEMSFRIAKATQVDENDTAAAELRKEEGLRGQTLTTVGLATAGVGGLLAAGGIGLLAWQALAEEE